MFDAIIFEIKQAKYYLVSVDSTLNITNFDQLTVAFRYVLWDGPVERFVKFTLIRGHTGYQLAEVFLEFVGNKRISLKDLKGQPYDNVSNMRGNYEVCKL